VTVVSQTSVKNIVCVLAGYVVRVPQNGAFKWKKKLTGVRSHAVTSNHTLKLKLWGGKNPTKIRNALHEVCGNNVVDRSAVSRWASCFREGRVSVQDGPRSGRPVTATDDTSAVIVSTLLEDRRESHEEVAHEANMSTTSVFRIVTQTLQKRKVAVKLVPYQLSKKQKAARKRVAEELLRCYEAEGKQFLEQNCCHR